MKVLVATFFFSLLISNSLVSADTITGSKIIELVETWSDTNGSNLTIDINERRMYPTCDQNLEVSPRYGDDYNTLKISCDDGTEPWSINVRTKKKLDGDGVLVDGAQLVVAKTSIPKGTIIQIDDLTHRSGTNVIVGQHYTLIDDVIGRRAKRLINAGQIIKPQYLEQLWLIEKDQTVIMVNTSYRIQVEALGIALENGNFGDRIRVENTKSGEKLLGLVKSEKKVQIIAKIN